MAYTRPKTNYRPLQYTPQNYNIPYEPLPYDQRQPTDDFYERLFKGTEKPTPPPEPEFDYLKEYQNLAGTRKNRLAYEEAVKAGYPEIERGKLSKVLGMIGAVGGTWATGDPERSTNAALASYFAPQTRATARHKEKLSGLSDLATMEDKDITEKIKLLEAKRRDYYDQKKLGFDTRSEARDIIGDDQERERRQLLLDEAKIEKKIDPHTGIEYRRRKNSNEPWVAHDKPGLSRAEEIMYEAMKAGENKRATEAIEQPNRMALEGLKGDNREALQTQRDTAAAARLAQRIKSEIGKPNATEEYRQRMSNLQEALILDPSLAKFVKEGPGGMLIPRGADDWYWTDPSAEDLAGIKKVQEAMTAGPKKPAVQTPAPGAPAAAGAVDITKLPKDENGQVEMIFTNGQRVPVDPKDVPKLLADKAATLPVKGAEEPQTPTEPAAPVVQQPTVPTPQIPAPEIPSTQVEEGSKLPTGFPYSSSQPFSGLGNTFGQTLKPTTPVPRPVNNPFASMVGEGTSKPAPMGTAVPPPNTQMPIAPELLQRNRFGPANVFGANIPLPGANPQQRMPPPQQPPIDLMPAPQPQRVGGPPPPQQRPPLPMNPIQLGPPVNAPMTPPPAAPINEVSGVQFGPTPQNQMNRTPFGKASGLTSPLTNPLLLSGGENSMNVTLPPPAPKKFFPDAPPSAPVGEAVSSPEEIKTFNDKIATIKKKFKASTGYEMVELPGEVRTRAEQYERYLEGRPELPGGREGTIRTKATGKPGSESAHQYSTAKDFGFTFKGKPVDITDKSKKHLPPTEFGEHLYSVMGKLAKAEGLEWGKDIAGLVDWPHLQLPRPGSNPVDTAEKETTKKSSSKNTGKKGKK